MTNPLLAPWTTPNLVCRPLLRSRTRISDRPLTRRLPRRGRTIAAIAAGREAPSFANTIEALELAEAVLDRVSGVFYNLAGADSTEAREALQRDLAPKMSAVCVGSDQQPALFARIEALWQQREDLGLTAEQMRVLTLYRQMFVRSGLRWTGRRRRG